MAPDSIGASAAAGIKIAVGTDAGLSPDHGTNLKELGLLGQVRLPDTHAGDRGGHPDLG